MRSRMRVQLILIALLAMMQLLTGCGERVNSGLPPPTNDKTERWVMPDAMPSEFDFSVKFGYGEVNKNEVNTYNDTVTKDLIVKGTTSANLVLTADEMASIYTKMKAIDIMDIDIEPYKPGNTRCEQVPYGEDTWRITIDGMTRELSWTDRYCSVSDDAEKLKQLRNDIMKIVSAREEYKALPEAEGGYD